jgi:osmotically-inducible protein OsmY
MSGSRQFHAVICAVILAGSLCACAVYRKCGFAGCPGDANITADVRALFNRYPALEPPNLIYVQTLDHVVYLTGQVNTDAERILAKSVALQAMGVTQVVNSINLGYQGR